MEVFKSGYVTLCGRANVGKSTLMNCLVGQKLSIVTDKPQTTRHRILAVLTEDNYQIIFLDTPGLLKPHYTLHEVMLKVAWQTIAQTDVLLFITEATSPPTEIEYDFLQKLKKSFKKKTILVINKIDLVNNKQSLLPLLDQYSKLYEFRQLIPISALFNDGIDKVLNSLLDELPPGEPLYPKDTLTDRPVRFFASEIIREKIFEFCYKELPYCTAVIIDEFREDNKVTYIKALIYVDKPSQKAIIIGEKGNMLKKIGTAARLALEQFLGSRVYLECSVKVRPGWRKNLSCIEEFGYGI